MLQDGYLHIDISIRIISSVMADCIGRIRLIWRWRACMRLAWALHCLNADGNFNLRVWKERPTEEWRLQPLHRKSFWKTHTHTLTQSHLVNIGQLFVNLGPSCALLSDVETCKDTITIINVPQLSSFRSFVTQIQVRSQPRSSWVAKNNNKRSALQNWRRWRRNNM